MDSDVLNLGALERDELYYGAMQCDGVKLRRRAALHVSHFRAFVGDDKRALELAEVFGIDPEVRLKRMFHLHARWDVNERAAAEHGGVQRAEFIVGDRDDFTKPFPEDFRIFFQSLCRSYENHALFADRLLDI